MTSFTDLGLSPDLLKAISECGYENPTPIQAQAIPHVLMMRDLVGLAQTGTGKTAGFTLPMIEILHGGRAKARMPRSLILSPTRELAAQIADNFEKYGKYTPLEMALLTGGSSMADQIKKLDRGVDVLIATPGRLLDLFERGRILMTDIKIFVIDEADRMLDMGFIPDIEKIASLLPPMRQTLLFSATMAPEIKKLTGQFLNNPKEVSVAPQASPAATVEQFLVHTTPRDKNNVLKKIIDQEEVKNAFIFCNRKRDVDSLAKWLKGKGYNAQALHGDMDQKTRTTTLEKFKNEEITLLVCSDVAGRGIDVQGVSHVFNYDVPMNADDYVHRIGRTGRAGMTGRAWMFASEKDDKFLEGVEKKIGKAVPVFDLKNGGDLKKGESSAPQKKTSEKPKSDKPKAAPKHNQNRAKSDQKPDHKHQDQKQRHAPKKSQHQNQKAKDQDDDETGFGDDIPAFFS